MGYYVDKLIKDYDGNTLKEINIDGNVYRWNSINKDSQDSNFNLLSNNQLEKFMNTSKIVESFNKNSYYIYSGTPEIIVGKLKYPLFATQLMRVARRYALNTGASSLYVNKKGGQPKILRFLITPNNKILDLRKKSERNKFNIYFSKHSLSGEYTKTKSGLPDWTEGMSIAEYIYKYNMNYDIVLLDEGNMIIDGKIIRDDGISYMILNDNVKLDRINYLN